jgi:hypothetical protein
MYQNDGGNFAAAPSVPNWYSPNQAQATDIPTPGFVPRPPAKKTVAPVKVSSVNKAKTSTPSSSGRVGTSAGGSIAPVAAAAPSVPSIDDYLSTDDPYQQQHLALQDALKDYQKQYDLQNSQYGTTYDQNSTALKKNRELSEASLTDDYASRGLMNSGIYNKAFTDLGTDYNNRQISLDTDKANFIANLGLGLTNFQDAINRRAAQYGV